MMPETEAAPEVHQTGHRLADRIVGFSAIFISLCSLALAIHHGQTMERLVEANSRPFLQFGTSNGEAREGMAPAAEPRADGDVARILSVTIANPGAGAARIDRFSIAIDGQAVADWGAVFKQLKGEAVAKHLLPPAPASSGAISYSTVAQSYLKAGSERSILRWPRTEANGVLWDYVDAARQANRVTFEACYCSIFDECWIAKSKSFRPVETKSCP